MACWPNGKALDYGSRDCRFESCVGHSFCCANFCKIRCRFLFFFFFCGQVWIMGKSTRTTFHSVFGNRCLHSVQLRTKEHTENSVRSTQSWNICAGPPMRYLSGWGNTRELPGQEQQKTVPLQYSVQLNGQDCSWRNDTLSDPYPNIQFLDRIDPRIMVPNYNGVRE